MCMHECFGSSYTINIFGEKNNDTIFNENKL